MKYRWGPFEVTVDGRNGPRAVSLWSGRERLVLPEHVARLLGLLLATPGALVSPADIVRGVWKQEPSDRGINAENVRVLVGQLRKIVGDDGIAQRFVQTVHQQGYRLVDVETVTVGPSLPPVLAIAAGAVLAMGTAVAWRVTRAPMPSPTALAAASPAAPATPPALAAPRPHPPSAGRAQAGRLGPPLPDGAPRAMESAPAASAPDRPAGATVSDAAALAAGPPPASIPPAAAAAAAPAPRTPAHPDLCPRLEALATRLADHDVLMQRLCASGDVGGVLNASGALFDLAGLPSDLRSEIDALAGYERHVEQFLPVGREAEAARAVRAECRDLRGGRSLWRLGWTAVRTRAEELRVSAACASGDTR